MILTVFAVTPNLDDPDDFILYGCGVYIYYDGGDKRIDFDQFFTTTTHRRLPSRKKRGEKKIS